MHFAYNLRKISGIILIAVFIFVALFLNLSMRFEANGMMGDDCPLSNNLANCSNLFSHLDFVSSAFSVTLLEILVLVSVLPIFFSSVFDEKENFSNSPGPGVLEYKKIYPDFKLFNPLRLAFSDGIISPILYA